MPAQIAPATSFDLYEHACYSLPMTAAPGPLALKLWEGSSVTNNSNRGVGFEIRLGLAVRDLRSEEPVEEGVSHPVTSVSHPVTPVSHPVQSASRSCNSPQS